MHTDFLDELSLRPLRRGDVDALVAIGYGTPADTTAMVDTALAAHEAGESRPMVIIRQCLTPDPRTFNGVCMAPLVLGVISDIGDVWVAADGPAEAPLAIR